MDTNEIMANEEVIETTEKIAKAGFEKGFKIGIGIGLAVLTGGIAYKYAVKPMVTKIKTKENQPEVIVVDFDNHMEDDKESEEN